MQYLLSSCLSMQPQDLNLFSIQKPYHIRMNIRQFLMWSIHRLTLCIRCQNKICVEILSTFLWDIQPNCQLSRIVNCPKVIFEVCKCINKQQPPIIVPPHYADVLPLECDHGMASSIVCSTFSIFIFGKNVRVVGASPKLRKSKPVQTGKMFINFKRIQLFVSPALPLPFGVTSSTCFIAEMKKGWLQAQEMAAWLESAGNPQRAQTGKIFRNQNQTSISAPGLFVSQIFWV